MISAVVISIDDNSHIEKCLRQLDFVDQIVIVGALEKADLGKFKTQTNIAFTQNLNDPPSTLLELGCQQCDGDWILGIQADLILTEDLKTKLILETQQKTENSVYFVKTSFCFMGKFLKYSSHRNQWTPMLWPNSKVESFTKQKLKEKVVKSYSNFDTFNQRITALCRREAYSLYHNKIRPNWVRLVWNPYWSLLKNFILRLGFLDGKEGFTLAYIEAFAEVKIQLFLWLKYRTIE